MDNATIERFLTQEPRLHVFRHYLDDIARRRAHTLSNAEEKLLAASSVMASGPSSVFGIFADADFPYPSVTLSDGKTVKLDKAAFSLYRASRSREDRQKVMEAFFTALGKYRGTFGSMMNSNVETSIFYAACAQLRYLPASFTRPAQHSRLRVFEVSRRSQSQSAHVPALPETPQAHDGTFRTPLLRSRTLRSYLRSTRNIRSTWPNTTSSPLSPRSAPNMP